MIPDLAPAHVGISVYNMKESLEWYERCLGYRLIKDDGFVPELKAHICFVERDGFELELFEYVSTKKIPQDRLIPNEDIKTVGTKHIAFYVKDMEVVKKNLLKNDVKIVHEVSMDGDHVIFIHDCNGVLIELIQK